jgi:hypothetical protein
MSRSRVSRISLAAAGRRGLLIAATLAAAAPAPGAPGNMLGERVGVTGSWVRYRIKDMMTGRTTCTALYHDRNQVQFSLTGLAILYLGQGIPSGYTYQIDDAPPVTAATDRFERLTSAVVFEQARYKPMLGGKQLRFRWSAGPGVDESVTIDLSELRATVREFAAENCTNSI